MAQLGGDGLSPTDLLIIMHSALSLPGSSGRVGISPGLCLREIPMFRVVCLKRTFQKSSCCPQHFLQAEVNYSSFPSTRAEGASQASSCGEVTADGEPSPSAQRATLRPPPFPTEGTSNAHSSRHTLSALLQGSPNTQGHSSLPHWRRLTKVKSPLYSLAIEPGLR